jgi:hypothetical protein
MLTALRLSDSEHPAEDCERPKFAGPSSISVVSRYSRPRQARKAVLDKLAGDLVIMIRLDRLARSTRDLLEHALGDPFGQCQSPNLTMFGLRYPKG